MPIMVGNPIWPAAALGALLRLTSYRNPTVPRRVYTNAHLEYVTEVTARLRRDPGALRGIRIAEQAPMLRHFTARFEPV